MNDVKQASYIKKFKTDECYYVYDVNTNEIFNVDEMVYTLIDRLDNDLNLISSRNSGEDPLIKYSPSSIERARSEIAEMRKQGYFSSHRPKITFFKGKLFLDTLDEVLNSKLERAILVLTEACNLRCKYCAYSGHYPYHRVHSHTAMTEEIMKKAVDFYLAHSTTKPQKHISFYGGEPLANYQLLKQCIDYMSRMNSSKTEYNLTTNGALLDREKIHFLVENDFGLLVSIDGPREIHDRYRVHRNGTGSFERIKKNLRLFQSLYPEYYKSRVRFNMVLAPPYNFEAISEFLRTEEFITQSGGVKFATVSKKDGTFYDQFSEAERSEHIQAFENLRHSFYRKKRDKQELAALEDMLYRKKFLDFHRRLRVPLPDPSPSHGQCTMGMKGLFVNADGSFNFCSQVEDVFQLGNVDTGYDWAAIKDIYFAMDDLFNKHCYGCWGIRLCNKCIKEVQKGGKIDSENFYKICAFNKVQMEEEITAYLKIREKNYNAFDHLAEYKVQ